jgi:hypothetical protein
MRLRQAQTASHCSAEAADVVADVIVLIARTKHRFKSPYGRETVTGLAAAS